MLISITSTSPKATDLGYLLHKHPDRVRTVDVGFGTAHVFYPEATADRCTASLLVEVDPVGLARKSTGRSKQTLEPYVNDRPYATSSMMSVAIGRLFGSAMAGSCNDRPKLVETPLQLEVSLPSVSVRGGEQVVRSLFEPLGYQVSCSRIPLDREFPKWGDSRIFSVELSGQQTVRQALEHLYVLLPVLDDRKHYWIGRDELEKLFRKGSDWLPAHPNNELITRRYLRYGGLARDALNRLAENAEDSDAVDAKQDDKERNIERPLSLNERRLRRVTEAVVASGGGRVADLGCGEGRLLARLLDQPKVRHLIGVDVSVGALTRAKRRIRLDEMSERRRGSVELFQGALTYTDDRLKGLDVATLVEVIEHIDSERLDVLSHVVFGHAAPSTVIVTTPNSEYNVHFEGLAPGALRHNDHRFEWDRNEFDAWVAKIGETYGYTAKIQSIGDDHPETGAPTQMAIFDRSGE